jgi:hypothetical protein
MAAGGAARQPSNKKDDQYQKAGTAKKRSKHGAGNFKQAFHDYSQRFFKEKERGLYWRLIQPFQGQ